MHATLLSRKKALRAISALSYLYLPISMIANYVNDRLNFVVLYAFVFLALSVHSYCYSQHKSIEKGSNELLIIIYGMFLSFYFLGEQQTFDVLWVLTLPLVTLVLSSYAMLKRWLIGYILVTTFMIPMTYFFPTLIRYDTFALFSLLWGGIFTSGIVLHYADIQRKLEDKIAHHNETLHARIREATSEISELNHSLEATQIEIVERLSTLAEFRSKETGAHVRRVGLYSKHLALLYGLEESTAKIIELAAPLHDIGKVGIEDSILHKPASLTSDEYERMKEHASIGETILSGSDKPLIQYACDISGAHHEKYDGTGYPKKLYGELIPISARIVAIADVFDALISRRAYKEGWDVEKIVEHFTEQKGKHFDPTLTQLFLDNISLFLKIYEDNQH